jgi:hypothetical protein
MPGCKIDEKKKTIITKYTSSSKTNRLVHDIKE